jgi:GNAT superfamily N-acetyltransferase
MVQHLTANIRPYVSEDLPALYQVCLATGDAGNDASHLYRDWKLIGHIYAAPYGVLSPETAFVVEDEFGVGGYIVGPHDTRAFEHEMETNWWPELRTHYADPPEPRDDWTPDQRLEFLIHHPPHTPKRICEPYPAHLHINLLPRLQAMGIGRVLIRTWLERMAVIGVDKVHLGVGPANERAVRFYHAFGFREIERLPAPYNVIWFGISTGR